MKPLNSRSCVVAVLAAALLSAGSAGAATVDECMGRVTLAKDAISDAMTFLNAKDQEGLIDKAIGANLKINLGKFPDAAKILYDMGQKVTTLLNAPKPKLDPNGTGEGLLISDNITRAYTCVNELMTQ